jgi:glucokinase
VLSATADYLAIAVVNLWRSFEPEMLVIGGGVGAAGDLLLGPLCAAVIRLRPTRPLPAHAVHCSTVHRNASVLAKAALILAAEPNVAAGQAGPR